MGASVSLPGPFAQFSRLSLSDVDEMIIRHRTQLDGAFMVTPQELEAIVGPKVKDAAAIIAQLEAGEEGKINALSFLCGAVAVCRTPAPGGGGDREDGVKAKARRMFALFDFMYSKLNVGSGWSAGPVIVRTKTLFSGGGTRMPLLKGRR